MPTFVITDIRILSRREKTATLVSFHPRATVIWGENDTGKSSIIKSIYWTFGADPALTSDPWKGLDAVAAVRFTLGVSAYTIVRHDRSFALFDGANTLLHASTGITKGVGPFLARLFDFSLLLNNKKTAAPETPPPAYFLLPYYVDQDHGWAGTWCSFAGLKQYSRWQDDVAEYHIGLRGAEYYRLKTQIAEARGAMEDPRREERALLRATELIRTRITALPVDFDLERFQREVSELAHLASGLADEEEQHRRAMGELSNKRTFLTQQLVIADHVMQGIRNDYTYTLKQPHDVECPTCGATYENSVVERFGLALDEGQCVDTVATLRSRIADVDLRIVALRVRMDTARGRHQPIWNLLEAKRGALTVHELLKGEARGQAADVLASEVQRVRLEVEQLGARVIQAQTAIKPYDSKERRKDFLERFSGMVARFCVALGVPAPRKLKKFAFVPHETGSDVPRAILAYNFSVLKFAWVSEHHFHAPVIIDSPNQQDQDLPNLRRMLQFIREQTPEGKQLIIGLVDSQGIDFGGTDVHLTRKRQALSDTRYTDIGAELENMLTIMHDALAKAADR